MMDKKIDAFGHELIPCTCGKEARVVVCGAGSYVRCPWCKRSTYMCTTKAEALKHWAAKKNADEGGIKMQEGLIYIKTDHIHPHPENPRKNLGELTELAESLKKNGVMQNLTVVPIEGQPGEYYALIGNRRHGAAELAGIEKLPCRVVEEMGRKEQISVMLEENMQRNDLTIYEQAQGFQLMLDLGETEDTIAEKTGFSKTTIRHRLNIAKLDQEELQKKEKSDCFQLTLKDLYELEKVEDINARNKILREAQNSRDLVWRAQNAVSEAKRKKKAVQLIELLEKEGIKKAPKGAFEERYTAKWEEVKEYDLDADIPKKIRLPKGEKEKGDTLYYLDGSLHYRWIRIIKKAKREKRQITSEEAERKQREKNKKEIKAEIGELDSRRKEFIQNILSGKIDPVKNENEIQEQIWKLLLEVGVYLSPSVPRYFFWVGKAEYDCTPEEKAAAKKKANNLNFTHSMLVVMHHATLKIDTYDWQGYYMPEKGNILKRTYEILAQYGWTFASEEEQQLIDGTHELYRKQENANEKR